MSPLALATRAALLLALCACRPAPERAAQPDRAAIVERGAYLATIMDCNGCHTPGALAGAPQADRALSGSEIGFDMPGLAVVYPPNLTPHPTTGLGGWSEAQIIAAVRTGTRPDGRQLAPVMPWMSYAKLTDADAAALAAYLKSLAPIDHAVPPPSPRATAPLPYLTLVDPRATAAGAPAAAPAPAITAPG